MFQKLTAKIAKKSFPLTSPLATAFLRPAGPAQLTPIPSLLRKEGRAHDQISTIFKNFSFQEHESVKEELFS
jgi:hypothetical protein